MAKKIPMHKLAADALRAELQKLNIKDAQVFSKGRPGRNSVHIFTRNVSPADYYKLEIIARKYEVGTHNQDNELPKVKWVHCDNSFSQDFLQKGLEFLSKNQSDDLKLGLIPKDLQLASKEQISYVYQILRGFDCSQLCRKFWSEDQLNYNLA